MKCFLPLTLLLSVLFYSCEKPDSQNNAFELRSKSEVKSVIDNFFIALGSDDSAAMEQILTNDFHMFEHDHRWNIDSLISLMPKTIGRVWEVSELEITQGKELTHVSYYNQGVVPNDRSWLESMLLIDEGGELKIKFMHSTKLYLN